MADTTVYKIPDMAGNSSVDPNLLLSMMNNGGMGGNGNWIWIIFLFFLYGWGRNGNGLFGGNDSNGTGYLASQAERDMLMQAINGNGQAIQSLSGILNTDISSIQSAINNIQSVVQGVGNQVGLTGQQVINSIQQGNMSLASQLCQCCCDNKLLAAQNQAATIQRIDSLANCMAQGFNSNSYETASQTSALQSSLQSQTQTIIDKLNTMEANAQQDKINTLTAQLTAANSRAERQSELQPIINELNAIKAAQPNTVSVQYPQLTVYPSYLGGNYTNGFWN